jgi:hypothetical protein
MDPHSAMTCSEVNQFYQVNEAGSSDKHLSLHSFTRILRYPGKPGSPVYAKSPESHSTNPHQPLKLQLPVKNEIPVRP